jgi:hypothetical protein
MGSQTSSNKLKRCKKDPVNTSDFNLNKKLYLTTQQGGGELAEAKVFAGLLGVHEQKIRLDV